MPPVPVVLNDPCALSPKVAAAEFQSDDSDQDEPAASAGTAANDARAAVPNRAPARAGKESFILSFTVLNYGLLSCSLNEIGSGGTI